MIYYSGHENLKFKGAWTFQDDKDIDKNYYFSFDDDLINLWKKGIYK